jgi:hypothetical protein
VADGREQGQAPSWEWVPVSRWGERALAIQVELEDLGHVLELMAPGSGPPGEPHYPVAVSFLRQARSALLAELAAIIVTAHRDGDGRSIADAALAGPDEDEPAPPPAPGRGRGRTDIDHYGLGRRGDLPDVR